MKTNKLLESSTVSLNELFGNGKTYRVPAWQRDYAWQPENWEDLWDDICQITESGLPHYMGAVVLQDAGNKQFVVIDGQQRLATLSIIAMACIKVIRSLAEEGENPAENQERAELLLRQYIGTKDPASLRYSSRLFLNETNDPFYQATLLQFRNPLNIRKLHESEALLWRAFQFFEASVRQRFESTRDGALIADFLNKYIAEKLVFTQILVEDELSAYTVFETLNSRGVALTATDLLKNFLFSQVSGSKTDLEHTKRQWAEITALTGLSSFPEFLQHHLSVKQKTGSRQNLFKQLKGRISTPKDVFDLLDELHRTAFLYEALERPADEFWADYHEARPFVRELSLFRANHYKPLIMAAYGRFDAANFIQLLRYCAVITFRYRVISNLNANELGKQFSQLAVQVSEGRVKTAREAFAALGSVYPDDEQFINSFSALSLNTRSAKKLVRYILVKLENRLSGKAIDFETTDATIEHILPENPAYSWEQSFSPADHKAFVYRLGNLTLLEEKKNRAQAGNAGYEEKKQVYQSSSFALSQNISAGEWGPEAIRARQRLMARIAGSVWRISE